MNKLNLTQFFIIVLTVLLVSGCAGVKYIPLESSITYPPTDSVLIFKEKPNVPYTELGIITAESSDYGEEKLLDMLKEKAMSIGAHGLIMRPPSSRTRTIVVPVSPGGTPMTPTTTTYEIGAIAIRFKEHSVSPEIKPSAPKVDLTPKPEAIPPEKLIKSTPITSPPGKNKIAVTGTSANIRSGAGNEFSIITIVKQGDKLILLGEYGDWYHVRLENGQEGWINNRFVK
jgi:uncharacterized protein YgiM (DUF1202 family)